MALLDLKTDLKSLKYGQDQPGGGSSNQPYIKTDINNVDRGFNQFRLTKFDDGLIRGGVVGAANAAIVDTLRIGKFFVDFPKGPLFIAKQVGLQLSNPKLQHIDTLPTNRRENRRILPTSGQGFLRNATNAITNTATSIGPFISDVANRIENTVGPTRIYNLGLNTLTQVPLNAVGGHIMRHGLLPTNDESKLYYNVVKTNNFNNSNNRLEGYANTFLLGGFSTPNQFNDATELTNYIGGPSSVYGIGTTAIRKPFDTITNNWTNINRSLTLTKNKTSNSYPSTVVDNNAIITIEGGAQTISFGTPTDVQQALSQFSIFKPKYSDTINFIDAYTRSIRQFNTLINKQVTGLRKRAAQPQQSSPNPQTPSQTLPAVVATTNDYTFKQSSDIRGGNTDRTWRTKEEMQEALDKAYSRTTEPYTNFNTVSNTQGTQQQLPDRFLGASRLDPDVKNKSVDSSIYDYTAINYSDVQPALRKYSELKKQIDAQTSASIGMTNQSLSSTSNNKVVVGNQLPSSTKTVSYENNYGEKIILSSKLPWNKISREVRIGSGRQDEINLTPMFDADRYNGSDQVTISGKTHNIRDLVKFRIQAVNTDGPDSGKWMVFRAYLTDLSDSTDATWNPVKYAGRGEPLYIYDSFSRKINISFKVAALSEGESRYIYQKLNFLMSNTMPDYNSNNLMRGPLTRLTVGNWVDSQLGILNSVQLKVPQDSPWEIAIDEPEGGSAANLLILPHIVEVSLTFTPIGSESKGDNRLAQKSDQISNIAQNNTGRDAAYLQYIQ